MGDVGEVEALRKQIEELQVALKAKENQQSTLAPYSKTYGRTLIGTIIKAADGGVSLAGRTLKVGGWVKTGREAGAGAFAFLEVNDGSSFNNLQVMVSKEVGEEVGGLGKITPTGTSVLIEGELVETPPENKKQAVELKAIKVHYVGPCDNSAGCYPLAKKQQSMEFLREKMHLRPRTNTIGVVARIRNALAFATHRFFQENGFYYVHTPIVTAADCEGAGEMFQVTTLLSEADKINSIKQMSAEELAALQEQVSQQGGRVKDAKTAAKAAKDNAELQAAVAEELAKLQQLKKEVQQQQELALLVGGIPRVAGSSAIDYSKDFFGKPAFLTVSGQLQAEFYACSLSNVYTFGPTFRAEESNTSRHLAEFWMIEPEMAFCDLADDMQCAEDYVKYCCKFLLDTCMEDLKFINDRLDKTCIARLQQVVATSFKRVTYTEAIDLLLAAISSKKVKFEFEVKWGIDLQSEHEKYLTGEIFKQPIIVYNYPKEIKAFYMRMNEDGKTVAAMDVLVPKIGELIGGSQREERLDELEKRIVQGGMALEAYSGYLDLRRYGTVPHAGFGLGFERLIMFATGLENIRDVIPFPRWPDHAEF